MSDRFSFPDEKSRVETLVDTGVQGAIDNSPSHEEEEVSYEVGNPPRPHGRYTVVDNKVLGRGGGLGVKDLIEGTEGSLDPELQYLKREYQGAVEKGHEKPFAEWLEDDRENLTPRFHEPGRREKEKPQAQKKETIVNPNTFNLMLNASRLDRLTKGVTGVGAEEAQENRAAVNSFFENWTSFKDDIGAVGFSAENGKITDVIMQLKPDKDGKTLESIVVPAHVFREVFGAWRYMDKRTGKETGLEFVGGQKLGKAFINPNTPQLKLDEIMRKISINGEKLNNGVQFFIVLNEAPIPIDKTIFMKSKVQV